MIKDRYTVTTAFVQSGFNTTKITEGLLKNLDTMQFRPAHYVAAGEVSKQDEFWQAGNHCSYNTIFGILNMLVLQI